MRQNRVYDLYHELREKYGHPREYWPNWCSNDKILKQREAITIGAILTQRTSWHNAEIALKNLKRNNLLSVVKIAKMKEAELTKYIRVAGFYTTKPKRIIQLCRFLVNDYGGLDSFLKQDFILAREELLSLYGIGQETADTILLYACDKPVFVIDEYTKRLVKRRRLAKSLDYGFLRNFFEKRLPRNYKIYRDFHALIIISQKGVERSRMFKF